jgi:hypothetical protein
MEKILKNVQLEGLKRRTDLCPLSLNKGDSHPWAV